MAVDGVWEEAVTFAPGEVPDVDGEDVACEAFFGEAFFGLRTARRGALLARHD
ncbi:MAG: hypothetical protein V9G10_12310 [Candidatus Nanopelagicales bacterium]